MFFLTLFIEGWTSHLTDYACMRALSNHFKNGEIAATCGSLGGFLYWSDKGWTPPWLLRCRNSLTSEGITGWQGCSTLCWWIQFRRFLTGKCHYWLMLRIWFSLANETNVCLLGQNTHEHWNPLYVTALWSVTMKVDSFAHRNYVMFFFDSHTSVWDGVSRIALPGKKVT